MPRPSILALAFLLGCGPASSSASPSSSSAAASTSNNSGAEGATESGHSTAMLLPETWAELAPHLSGIYVGRLVHRETATPGVLDFCEVPERAADARPEGSALPGEWCGSENQPPIGFGWAPLPGAPTWILTRRDASGTERPHIVHACEGACTELPAEAILAEVRCHHLTALQTGEHDDLQVCTVDADCEVLTAMCFDAAVARAYAPAYRASLEAHWGECLGPGAGMCPPRAVVARCEAGRCTGH